MTQVLFSWERRPSQPSAEALRQVVRQVLDRCGVRRGELHVLITGDDQLRALNRQYRDVDEPTDVLSFADGGELPEGRTLLGELVISLDRARIQAREQGHSELTELAELVLHGTLHLLGYDHVNDSGEMDALELKLRGEVIR